MKTLLLLCLLFYAPLDLKPDAPIYIRIKNNTNVVLKNIEIFNGIESKAVKTPYISPQGTFSAYIKVNIAYSAPIITANPYQSFLVGEGAELPPGKYTYIIFIKDVSRNLLGIKIAKR